MIRGTFQLPQRQSRPNRQPLLVLGLSLLTLIGTQLMLVNPSERNREALRQQNLALEAQQRPLNRRLAERPILGQEQAQLQSRLNRERAKWLSVDQPQALLLMVNNRLQQVPAVRLQTFGLVRPVILKGDKSSRPLQFVSARLQAAGPYAEIVQLLGLLTRSAPQLHLSAMTLSGEANQVSLDVVVSAINARRISYPFEDPAPSTARPAGTSSQALPPPPLPVPPPPASP